MQDDHAKENIGKSRVRGKSRRNLILGSFLAILLVGMAATVALVLLVSARPETDAQGADWLRNLIGNKPVTELEAIVFTIQDKFHQFVYNVEQSTPSAPCDISNIQAGTAPNSNSLSKGTPPATPSAVQNSTNPVTAGENMPINASLPNASDTPGAVLANLPQTAAPVPTQPPWVLANLTPLGKIVDEGIWTPYIQDASGVTVAYRTFLEPDPARPYVTVGIVAFDLARTQLHYLLGSLEPTSDVGVARTDQIPPEDRISGILLAAFNGGFKTIHGHYGVFTNGTVLVPPIEGMATLVIYNDGRIRIGEWGSGITYTPDIAAYRQNCPLMVRNGEINPLVYNRSINDWGGTISGNIVTFRTGIGISQDGKTLYYFAGNSLTMPVLAKAMQDADSCLAMQLDINNYYVFFTSFEV